MVMDLIQNKQALLSIQTMNQAEIETELQIMKNNEILPVTMQTHIDKTEQI